MNNPRITKQKIDFLKKCSLDKDYKQEIFLKTECGYKLGFDTQFYASPDKGDGDLLYIIDSLGCNAQIVYDNTKAGFYDFINDFIISFDKSEITREIFDYRKNLYDYGSDVWELETVINIFCLDEGLPEFEFMTGFDSQTYYYLEQDGYF